MDHKSKTEAGPVGVNFCIIKEIDGEPHILLQQRDQNSPQYKGCWVIPGGALDAEDANDLYLTASREAYEEFNISIPATAWTELCDRPRHNPGKVFVACVDETTEAQLHEGAALQWFPNARLPELELGYLHSEFIVPELQRFVSNHNEHVRELTQTPTRHELEKFS